MIVELDIGTIAAYITIAAAIIQLVRWLYNKIIHDISKNILSEIECWFINTDN